MKHVLEELRGSVRRKTFQLGEPGQEACLSNQLTGRGVVRVTVLGERCENDGRPEGAEKVHNRGKVILVPPDSGVRKMEAGPLAQAKNVSGSHPLLLS
jgi:hypothetical protein